MAATIEINENGLSASFAITTSWSRGSKRSSARLAAGGDHVGHLLGEQVDHLDLARTVYRPHLAVIDRKHAVRTRVIVLGVAPAKAFVPVGTIWKSVGLENVSTTRCAKSIRLNVLVS